MDIVIFFILKYSKDTITSGAGPFHGIHMDCSMESIWTYPWNPWWWIWYGVDHSITIPWSFHMDSMDSRWIPYGLYQGRERPQVKPIHSVGLGLSQLAQTSTCKHSTCISSKHLTPTTTILRLEPGPWASQAPFCSSHLILSAKYLQL